MHSRDNSGDYSSISSKRVETRLHLRQYYYHLYYVTRDSIKTRHCTKTDSRARPTRDEWPHFHWKPCFRVNPSSPCEEALTWFNLMEGLLGKSAATWCSNELDLCSECGTRRIGNIILLPQGPTLFYCRTYPRAILQSLRPLHEV